MSDATTPLARDRARLESSLLTDPDGKPKTPPWFRGMYDGESTSGTDFREGIVVRVDADSPDAEGIVRARVAELGLTTPVHVVRQSGFTTAYAAGG